MEINSNMKTKNKNSFSEKVKTLLSENFIWVLVLIVSFIAFLLNPVFYSLQNLYNLLILSSVVGILVLAETLVLLTGNFDNSLEFALILTSMVAAWLMVDDTWSSGLLLPAFPGIVIMLLVGAVIGAFNGFFVGYVKMNSFITTFATSVIANGLSVLMSGGAILDLFPEEFQFLGRAMIGPVPFSGLFVLGLFILFHFIFKYTYLGRSFYVVGGNIEAAKALGVDVRKTQLIAFILAGLLAAVGGWILAGRLNSASSQMTTNQLLLAFGAAVIGGVRLGGGEAKISSMYGGVVLITSIYTLLNLAQVDPYFIRAVTGLVILGAMLVDALRSREFLTSRN
jgi:ribose/xylose/arabinose/galactoside ABC-type transport system permease subunit